MTRLTAPPAGITEGLRWTLFNTGFSIEEVSRLAGEAACVTPAVRARRWTGQTQTPARVLIGALRTMPATLVSEKKVTFNAAVADLRVLCGACFAAHLAINALSRIRILHLSHVTRRRLANPVLQLVALATFGAYVAIGAEFTISHAGQAGIVTPVRVQSPGAVCPTATLMEETLLSVFINSTGSAFEELVSAALGTGGMAEDTLALQHKLSARTRRRGRLASDESDAVGEEQERGETSHGRLRGIASRNAESSGVV